MNLSRAIDLLEMDLAAAKPRVIGGAPVVEIPLHLARAYLSAMREAQERMPAPDEQLSERLWRYVMEAR